MNRNTVVQDTTWNVFKWKPSFEKVKSMVKWTADAILTEEQVKSWYYYSKNEWVIEIDKEKVIKKANIYAHSEKISDETRQNNSFSYVSEKDNIIHENIQNIILEIRKNWKLSSDLSKDLLSIYIDKKYISINNIKLALLYYFKNEIKRIYNKANSPLKIWCIGWKTKTIKSYHDIDHDLFDKEKQILAFWIKEWFLTETEFNRIVKILKIWWDDLDFFCKYNYKKNLIEIYLSKLWNK